MTYGAARLPKHWTRRSWRAVPISIAPAMSSAKGAVGDCTERGLLWRPRSAFLKGVNNGPDESHYQPLPPSPRTRYAGRRIFRPVAWWGLGGHGSALTISAPPAASA